MKKPEQVAYMECCNDACKGEGKWFNPSGNREWFVYAGDSLRAYNCPVCKQPGRQYIY